MSHFQSWDLHLHEMQLNRIRLLASKCTSCTSLSFAYYTATSITRHSAINGESALTTLEKLSNTPSLRSRTTQDMTALLVDDSKTQSVLNFNIFSVGTIHFKLVLCSQLSCLLIKPSFRHLPKVSQNSCNGEELRKWRNIEERLRKKREKEV